MTLELQADPIKSSRRRWPVAAAAAAAVVLLLGGLLVGGVTDRKTSVDSGTSDAPTSETTSIPSPAPSSGRVGYLGIPPAGAAPTMPATSELVVSWRGAGVGYVYADGRVVSLGTYSPPLLRPDPNSTGWVEQRLTPEGVDTVRTEILSTGRFDANVPQSTDWVGYIAVRNGDRLVTRNIDRQGPPSDLLLLRRLVDLQSWLPAAEWESRELTAYVPTNYMVCVTASDLQGPARLTDRASIVALLPARAQELLGTTTIEGQGVGIDCSELTTQDARELAASLDAAGIDVGMKELGLHYAFDVSGFGLDASDISPDAASTLIGIYFTPFQPDGTPSMW